MGGIGREGPGAGGDGGEIFFLEFLFDFFNLVLDGVGAGGHEEAFAEHFCAEDEEEDGG